MQRLGSAWRLGAIGFAAALLATPARAAEGMWPPDELGRVPPQELRRLGLELTAAELWSADGGLLRAAVGVGGCSGGFVSADGLIATNHHCVHRALQAASTPETDHLARGFLARTRAAELPARGLTVEVLRAIRDVTEPVLAAARAAPDDAARFRAVDAAVLRLEQECERPGGVRCEITSFHLGKQWKLFEVVELTDVRLVYAPPSALGEYGGEIDNWRWPRHTADFALVRAWAAPDGKPAPHAAANAPYRPARWLEPSAEGVRPGDFVGVMGYPGQTQRNVPAPEVERSLEQVLPGTLALHRELLEALEAQAKRGRAIELKGAGLAKGLANREKNSRGMMAGMRRLDVVGRRQREGARMAEWAAAPERSAHRAALEDLRGASAVRRAAWERGLVLGAFSLGPSLPALALDLVRRARERAKPDAERRPAYRDRNAPALLRLQERRLRDTEPGLDAALLAVVVARARRVEGDARVEPLARLGPAGADRAALERGLARLVGGSRLDEARLRALWDAPLGEVMEGDDPLLKLASELAPIVEAHEAAEDTRRGLELRVAPLYLEALEAARGAPPAPDANGTLRFSLATVRGYSPEEGLVAEPRTTLGGALAKHTGEPPFALPEAVRERAAAARDAYWADPELGDVPLCFLADADTTGGNSGSPVIDRRGRLVGLNFDRVWENIAGDYGWSKDRSRSIVVDVRAMLWLLDRVEGADALLVELGVAQHRSATRRAERSGGPLRLGDGGGTPRGGDAGAPRAAPRSAGCGVARGGVPAPALAGLLSLVAAAVAARAGLRRGAGRGPLAPGAPRRAG